MSLWSLSVLSKIASQIGEPLEVDHRIFHRKLAAGVRLLVLIDASAQPLESIDVVWPDGSVLKQPVKYDYFPHFCSKCRRMGHSSAACTAAPLPERGTLNPPRKGAQAKTDDEGWEVQGRRRNRARTKSAKVGRGRSKDVRPPSPPRRSRSVWRRKDKQPVDAVHSASPPARAAPTNTHIYFPVDSDAVTTPSPSPAPLPNQHTYFQSASEGGADTDGRHGTPGTPVLTPVSLGESSSHAQRSQDDISVVPDSFASASIADAVIGSAGPLSPPVLKYAEVLQSSSGHGTPSPSPSLVSTSNSFQVLGKIPKAATSMYRPHVTMRPVRGRLRRSDSPPRVRGSLSPPAMDLS